jgi:tetratricopeptide (TPR) repeat protein
MLERKAVINAGVVLAIILAATVKGLPVAVAQSGKPTSRKTVGDLLKRIESNTKKVKLNKTKSALPQFKPLTKAPPQNRQNFQAIKPPARSSLYAESGTNEAQLEKVTDDSIDQLYKLTQQFKNSKRRGELWLRLAEQYVEKSRLIEYKVQQKYDDQLHAYQSGKTKVKPKLDLRASQVYNRKAVELYEWFLRDYPNDPKIDQALFFLGYNYFELDKPDVGKDYYRRLTTEHPKSSYIEEANFALGEYYFDREKWADALKYYEAVAANKRARLYSFALYKEAWCLYKTGKVKQALMALERVIHAGRAAKGAQDGSSGGVSRIRLATEAQKDLVVFYAETGSAKDARGYFVEIAGEKHVFGLLEKLAYYYVDVGNREGARYIFKELIEERPNAPKAYDYQYQIVTMYTSTEKGETFKSELANWIQNYSPNSEWAKANAKDQELVTKANQLIETTLRNYILQQHQTAQNSKVPSAQKSAVAGYELYFQTFEKGSKLDEMHFFYAELLFDMKDYDRAAVHYNWVIEHAPKSQYYEKASLNTVLALEKGLPTEEQLKKQVGDRLEPVQLQKNVAAFDTAADRYITANPKGENVPAIRYKLGVLYYYHNQFDKALVYFNTIIKEHPKSPYAQYSANLTLDIYNLRKDYGGLEKAGQDILNNEDLAKSSVGMQVKGVLQRANFKKAQDLEANKDFAGAAAAYEDFAKKNAGGELGTSASFNAAVNYEKAGDLEKAIGMYGLVIADRSGKNEKLKKDSSKFIASLYEKTGQYAKAAESFESYARKHEKDKGDKQPISYYFNAAIIRDGMNQYTLALNNYQKYFDLSRSADKWEAILLMAKLWERRGNITRAQNYYKQYYDARPKNPTGIIEAAFMVAQIHARKNHKTDAEDWYKKVIYQVKQNSTKQNPVGASYAAEAKYILVAKTYDDLRAIRIPNNPAKQGAAVQEKLGMLNKLKEQLKDVIRYDDGYMVVNSLTLIGQAYQHMSASIYAVPLPKGLDDEGMKQYKAGVDKVAQPFTEEAIKNYEAAIKKGFELEGYNQGLHTAERELNRLKKGSFPDYGEKAIITKMPDPIGIDTDKKYESAWKAKDESMMVEAASKVLGKDQNDLGALNALALLYMHQGKLGMGRILISRALKARPDEPGLHNNMGVIFLNENKQRMAIGSFRKATEIKHGYPIGSANLGSIFVEYKDFAKAKSLLEEGYTSVKSDLKKGVGLDVANNYALALSGTGEIDSAKSLFKDILKADNQNTTALLNYAILLTYKAKDKKEAEKTLNRLKFLVDDGQTRAKLEDLEKALNETSD